MTECLGGQKSPPVRTTALGPEALSWGQSPQGAWAAVEEEAIHHLALEVTIQARFVSVGSGGAWLSFLTSLPHA